MIKFRNVNKSFGRNTVLKDISFTVDKGNLVTIIGASGCGKTTTLKMINRADQAPPPATSSSAGRTSATRT